MTSRLKRTGAKSVTGRALEKRRAETAGIVVQEGRTLRCVLCDAERELPKVMAGANASELNFRAFHLRCTREPE